MRRAYLLLVWLLLTAVFTLSACMPTVEKSPVPAFRMSNAMANATPTLAYSQPNALKDGNARVEHIQIEVVKSYPAQVNISVNGILPNNCAYLTNVEIDHIENIFILTFPYNQPKQGANCMDSDVGFSQRVVLPIAGLDAGSYKVIAGSAHGSFTLAADSQSGQEVIKAVVTLSPNLQMGSVNGRIWHDNCENKPIAAEENTLPTGCIHSGVEQVFLADGIQKATESGLANVQVTLQTGDCNQNHSAELLSVLTDGNGRYQFNNILAGNYCVVFDPLDSHNAINLDSGQITFPSTTGTPSNKIPVTFSAGNTLTDINFGYDLHHAPYVADETTNCKNSLAFIADLTIPDDSQIQPGTKFVKSWRVRNNGTCTWDETYRLVEVGTNFGGDTAVAHPFPSKIMPGERIDLSITMLAPLTPGIYRSNWQIADANSNLFGLDGNIEDAIWLRIIVDSADNFTVSTSALD